MANTTRKPRTLKPEAAIAAEAAIEAQKAAREGNLAALNAQVREALLPYYAAEAKTDAAKVALGDAEDAQRVALEATYLRLADVAHVNSLDADTCAQVLNAALSDHYGAAAVAMSVGKVSVLRSKLLRAMQPKVRGAIRTVIKPWADAWEAETAAIEAEKAAAKAAKDAGETRAAVAVPTPLRDKFDNRGNTITQALQLAVGSEAKGRQPAVASVVVEKPENVLTWVSEHPRQKRGARTPAGTPAASATTTAPLTARQTAVARVDAIIALVKALQADYPHALDTIQPVIEALAHVTGDRLVPLVLAEKAADKPLIPAKPPAEPVAGAAELDSAMSDADVRELALLRQLHALRAGK